MPADGTLFGRTPKLRVIDLFAGLEGWTEGATQAGLSVAWAANHWPAAVDWHAANHPGTIHACQDLHQTAWPDVPTLNQIAAIVGLPEVVAWTPEKQT